MTEQDVINAFLLGAKAESPPLRTDGTRLCLDRDVIAEWNASRLVVEPRRQSDDSERCKDSLTNAILLRMSRNQEVRRLLRRSCRDLLGAAARANRPARWSSQPLAYEDDAT